MKISAVVTTYNHEKYIQQCVEGILLQEGNFELEVILGDDCSTDRTGEILDGFAHRYPSLFVKLSNTKNLGIVKNFKRCIDACTGAYIAICEGDDYWVDPQKLQKQVDLLEQHPEYSMCFSSIGLYYQEEDRLVPFRDQLELVKKELTIEDLIQKNYIGNFSCCMYRTEVVRNLPAGLFDIFTVDWMFNMACSEFGKIGFIRDQMSVYRKHSGGAWTGKTAFQSLTELKSLIDVYNEFFIYKYDKQFMAFRKEVENELNRLSNVTDQVQSSDELPKSVSCEKEVSTSSSISSDKADFNSRIPNRDIVEETDLTYPPPRGSKFKLVRIFKDIFRPYWRALIRLRNKAIESYYSANWVWKDRLREFWKDRFKEFWKGLSIIRINKPTSLKELNDMLYRKYDLVILDTIFPHPLSPFRYEEFTTHLREFPDSLVMTTGEHMRMVDASKNVKVVIGEFENKNPDLRGRTKITMSGTLYLQAHLAYTTFLYNIFIFLDILEKKHIPFVFTLYPGGAFEINQPKSDLMLQRVLSSSEFRKVIVTQKLTYDYLLSNRLCSPDQIEFIYGVVSSTPSVELLSKHKYYGFEKDTLDICFVAYKYMEKGIDKGYDVFIAVAKQLAALRENINFHVVGNFTNADIPLENLSGRITFHGVQNNEWVSEFYLDKDIILSPNAPFKLLKGQFDGFPTASCTDAAFQGVAVFCTDLLDLNIKFIDREDIVIIPYDVDKIVTIVNHYHADPGQLRDIARRGSAVMREVYSSENQITPRQKVLQQVLENEKAIKVMPS